MKTLAFGQICATFAELAGSRWRSLLLCLFAGAVGSIPYFCEGLFILTFISLVLQFYLAIRQKISQRRVFLPFFCFFIGFYTPLYLFLSELYPYDRFGFSETQAGFIVVCSCILIPLLHAAVEATVLLLSRHFKNEVAYILGYASLWCIGEWILTLGSLAFPWGNIAVSLTGFLPYLQTASLFGRYFITFVTVGGCAAIACGVLNKTRLVGILGASAILLNTFIGTVLWFIPNEQCEGVKVAAIQGNVLSNEKWLSKNRTEIFEQHISMVEEAAQNGAKVILLAESAIPIAFTENGRVHSALAEITMEYGVTVVTGAHYYDGEYEYNSVIAVLPNGELSERYDKRHLVPFGEFIPFVDIIGELFPFVGAFNETSSSFTEGSEPIVIETTEGNIGPLVCFDSIFSEFASESVENGAEILAIVTNDSWFNDSIGIYTHLRHAQLRAIENSRFVMRAANTGVSAFIDSQGQVIASTEPLTVDTLYADAMKSDTVTLYNHIGDAMLYISFIITAFFIIQNARRTKDGKTTASQN